MRNFLFTILGSLLLTVQMLAQSNCFSAVTVVKDPTKSGWNLTANIDGIAPFTYLWSNGKTEKTIYVETPGEYCVTITAADKCVSKSCGKVVANSGCSVTIQKTTTGKLEAFPQGVAPFTYLWKTPAGQFKEKSVTPTLAGEYCVQITDANKCTSIACFNHIPVNSDSCAVKIGVQQAGNFYSLTAVYQPANPANVAKFIWNTGATTQTITTEKAGEYCVTIYVGGCTAKSCVTIGKIDSSKCSVRIVSQQVGVGVYRLRAVSTGKAPFKYQWSTGETKNFIFVGMEKEYCVTVTDATGCKATACIKVGNVVTPPTFCAVAIQQTNSGELLALTKGIAPFKFTWTGPNGFTANTQGIKPPTPGEYCVVLLTADSCRSKACFNVAGQDCGVEIVKNSAGTELIANAKGAAPFTYQWTGPNGFTTTTQGIKPPTAGDYCVKITASNGCTAKACVNFTNAPPCSVYITISNSGELIANPTGKEPIKYAWTGPNGFASDKKGFLPTVPGEYCVRILTADSCEAKACFVLLNVKCNVVINMEPPAPGAVGFKLTAVAGGTGPFTYKWSTGDTTKVIYGQSGKEYCVTITGANNCQAKACIGIPSSSPIECKVEITKNADETELTANATGTGPFTYEWTTPTGVKLSTQSIKASENGTYCVTAISSGGCISRACVTFFKGSRFCTVGIVFNNNGGLEAVSSNTSVLYLWTGPNGFTAQSKIITPPYPGEYCVIARTSDGICDSKACVTIGGKSCSVIIVKTEPTPGTVGYKLTANPIGKSPFTYKWSSGETTQSIYGQPGKEYCVVISTADNCEAKACITIPTSSTCSVEILADTVSDGKVLYLTAKTTGTAPYKFIWSNGSTDQIIRVTEKGEYCITVTDSKGCVAKACFKKLAINESFVEERGSLIGQTVLVYPNPVSDYLRVENTSSEEATISLFDISGKLLTQKEAIGNSTLEIPMNTYNSGSYILHIKSLSQSTNHKIVKQ